MLLCLRLQARYTPKFGKGSHTTRHRTHHERKKGRLGDPLGGTASLLNGVCWQAMAGQRDLVEPHSETGA